MNPDDHVCLCFHVSKRKIVNYCRREKPQAVSQISECLSAGTGCGWCVPFLQMLYDQTKAGVEVPDLPFAPAEYAQRRARYRQTGMRMADAEHHPGMSEVAESRPLPRKGEEGEKKKAP